MLSGDERLILQALEDCESHYRAVRDREIETRTGLPRSTVIVVLESLARKRFISVAFREDHYEAAITRRGYYDFNEAAVRAAQIGVDLQIPGIMAFYSWPSLGTIIGYPADEATIEASERFITEFLMRFVNDSGARRIHIIAHSMGNRGLLRAFQRIADRVDQSRGAPFDQIVLAAPDIDARVFRNLAHLYSKVAKKTTLYVSSKDRALASSGLLHGHYPRAGFAPPVTVVPGLDTIEVTNIDLTLLGHGYFSDARDILHDINNLIVNGIPPIRRMGLRRIPSPSGDYWVIKA
jgi:esterase/lipase superfamily enzyme